ncbi:MAG: ACP S-malonyltransferase [Acidimicrobiales bacterium]|nr:ACP S-malonyltransferase [Acidimicrobiales bacterium]
MRTAFVFPGQAAQRAGMASAWADTPHAAAFDLVGERAGIDLRTAADDADACAASTALAQPAIHAASLAAFDALLDAGVRPDVVAGHSLGEVTAAVAAGVLARRDGADLVVARGEAMGRACAASPGAMAAIVRLDLDVVEDLVARVPDACIANANAPGQVVVAGTPEAVDEVGRRAAEQRGRALPLKVEGAFHSEAMAPAVVRVDTLLRHLDVQDPAVPVVSGIDGLPRTSGEAVARALVDGILAPVRWIDVQHALAADEVDLIVEVGPGGVLAGCAKRTVPDLPCVSVAGPEAVADVLAALDAQSVHA